MSCPWSRRRFLGAAAASAAVPLLPGIARATVAPPTSARHVASTWIPRGEQASSYAAFKRVVEAATDFSWLSSGDRVLLKLALNSNRRFPATTDPWALDCMLRLLAEKGAGAVLVGDQSGIEHVHQHAHRLRGSSRHCCARAGLLPIILEHGAEPIFFEEAGWHAYVEATPPGEHHWPGPLFVSEALEEVDHVVLLPRVASHATGAFTSGMKMAVGFLRGDSRLALHQGGQDFCARWDEVTDVAPIASRLRLVLSSGSKVLATIGPDIGQTIEPEHGLLFASEDLLAHELLAGAWLRWNREHRASRQAMRLDATVVRQRNSIHADWARRMWPRREQRVIDDLPDFVVGDLWKHPAVLNRLARTGRPERIEWEQLAADPGLGATAFMAPMLRSPA
jgi:uncharacterized protein (DUF362 family)